jgi:hypothetical protein
MARANTFVIIALNPSIATTITMFMSTFLIAVPAQCNRPGLPHAASRVVDLRRPRNRLLQSSQRYGKIRTIEATFSIMPRRCERCVFSLLQIGQYFASGRGLVVLELVTELVTLSTAGSTLMVFSFSGFFL